MSAREGNLWGVVLAAGSGRRMGSLTRALYGQEVPKQFASFYGGQTLLQQTMDRLSAVVPPQRTLIVVDEAFAPLAQDQVASWRGVEVVSQPRNLGTGPGTLLGMARIQAKDPDARVIITGSHHFVGRPAPFRKALQALDAATFRSGEVTVIGVTPDHPACDRGWIVGGAAREDQRIRNLRAIHRMTASPPKSIAMLLLGTGALWSTSVIGGSCKALWSLSRRHLPAHTASFYELACRNQCAAPDERAQQGALYEDMLPADFDRDVLGKGSSGGDLGVLAAMDCLWSAWTSPDQVFRSLEGTSHFEPLVDRIVSRMQIDQKTGISPVRSFKKEKRYETRSTNHPDHTIPPGPVPRRVGYEGLASSNRLSPAV